MKTWQSVRRRPWVLAVVLVVALVSGYIAYSLTPVEYQSTAVVNVAASPVVAATDLFGSADFAVSRATTYVGLVQSSAFAAEAAAIAGATGAPVVTASVTPDTSLVTVSASGRTAQESQQVANAVAELLRTRAGVLDVGPDNRPALNLTVVQPADLPTAPVQPVLWIYIVGSLIAGLVSGVALCRLRARSDQRVAAPADLLRAGGISGTVFWLPDRRWNGAATGPQHAEYAERLAAIHQEFVAMPGRDSRILLISPPDDTHADTARQVVDDLSTTLVRGGRRVLILRLSGDANLEHRPGLSDVLSGTHAVQQVVFRDNGRFDVGPGQQVLRLLTATEREIRAVVGQLLTMVEFIIVDAPPLNAPVGFPVMSQVADAVLITATPKDVRTDQLVRARATVQRLRARYLGVLMAPRGPLPGAGASAHSGWEDESESTAMGEESPTVSR